MIRFLLRHWKLAGSVLAVVMLAGLFTWQDHRIRTLKAERDRAVASVASYESSLETLRADIAVKIQALEHERDREVARTRNLQRLLGQIEGTSNEKDGPVAPVLRGTFDRLYRNTENRSESD
jgi:hypothetical protein